MRYILDMIKDFGNKETEKVFDGQRSRRLPADLHRQALRKLLMIDAATDLEDLRVPPGNMLEALEGDRKGQHSIRINKQWRICFIWKNGDAYKVEITDYH